MDSIEEVINQADILYNQGQYEMAKDLITPLLEENMSTVIIKIYLKILLELHDYQDAISFSEEHLYLLESDEEFINLFVEIHLNQGIFLGMIPYIKEKVNRPEKYIDFIIKKQNQYILNNEQEINKIVKKLKHLSNYDDFFDVQKFIDEMQKLSYDLLEKALRITLIDEDLNLLIRNMILIKIRTFYFNANIQVLNYKNEIMTLNPNEISGFQSSEFMKALNFELDEKINNGDLIYLEVKSYLNQQMKLFYPYFDFDISLLINLAKRQLIFGDVDEYLKILKREENNLDKINKIDKMKTIFEIIKKTNDDLIKQFN